MSPDKPDNPAEREAQADLVLDRANRQTEASTTVTGRGVVLILDERDDAREMYRHFLESEFPLPWYTVTAATPEQAATVASGVTVHVLVADARQWARWTDRRRELGERTPQAKLVLIGEGASGFAPATTLQKPVRHWALTSVVRRLIDERLELP